MGNRSNVCFIIDEPMFVGIYQARWSYSSGMRVWRDLRDGPLDSESVSRMAQARLAHESWALCTSSDLTSHTQSLLFCDVVVKVVPVALGIWPFPRLLPYRFVLEIEMDPLSREVISRRVLTLSSLFPKAIFRFI